MYAIIETGGKQYRVSEGDILYIEKLDAEADSTVEFDRVMAVGKEDDSCDRRYPLSRVLKFPPKFSKTAKRRRSPSSPTAPRKDSVSARWVTDGLYTKVQNDAAINAVSSSMITAVGARVQPIAVAPVTVSGHAGLMLDRRPRCRVCVGKRPPCSSPPMASTEVLGTKAPVPGVGELQDEDRTGPAGRFQPGGAGFSPEPCGSIWNCPGGGLPRGHD